MKTLYFIIAMSSLCLQLNAQSNAGIDRDVTLIARIAEPMTTNVSLVWVPANPKLLQAGIDNGYRITRYLQADGTDETLLSDLPGTEMLLANTLKPLAEGDTNWASDLENAAEYLLYYKNPDIPEIPQNEEDVNLADAFRLTQDSLDRYQYGLALAFQNHEIAVKMALGFKDQSAEANKTYIYKIQIIGTNYVDAVTISTSENEPFKEFDLVEGFSELGVVKVLWNIEELSHDYYAYDIYRRELGGSFSKLNEQPYIFFDSADKESNTFIYQDRSVTHGTTYEYKLVGLTLFGSEGNESDVVTVQAIPEFINMAPIVTVDDADPNQVLVTWEDGNAELASYVTGYNVYRSEHATKGFEKLNTAILTNMSFIDIAPINSGYYIISAVDQTGGEHESFAEFAQIPDHIAPPLPSDFAARVSDKNQFELTWSPQETSDLKGHLIFAQLDGTGTVIMVSPDIITDTVFHYSYAPDILAEEICFQISSIDHRGNTSDKSPCLTVDVPDHLAPSKPLISLAEPRKAGNLIGWGFSVSDDVVRHEVQRKAYESTEWVSLLQIMKSEEAEYLIDDALLPYDQARFIDDNYPESRAFDYRIMAIDDSGNKSYSKRVSLKPYVSRFVGDIENFTLGQQFPSSTQPQLTAYTALSNAITEYGSGIIPDLESLNILVDYRIITQNQLDGLSDMTATDAQTFLIFKKNQYWSGGVYAHLAWDYAHTDDLLYFQIYRSVDGQSFIDYVDILPTEHLASGQFSYDDVFVFTEREYMYKIVAIHTDGRFSDVSKTLRIVFQQI